MNIETDAHISALRSLKSMKSKVLKEQIRASLRKMLLLKLWFSFVFYSWSENVSERLKPC